MTLGLAAGVLKGTETTTDCGEEGKLVTTPLFGKKLHTPPAGNPAVHAMVTVPGLTKFALAVNTVLAALETFPAPMVTGLGASADALNWTTCRVSG